MPNFDKTGPAGQGPMTGRGLGSCSDNRQKDESGFVGQGQGRGLGRGRGAGCCGRGFLGKSQLSLEEQEKCLEDRLKAVRKIKNSPESKA